MSGKFSWFSIFIVGLFGEGISIPLGRVGKILLYTSEIFALDKNHCYFKFTNSFFKLSLKKIEQKTPASVSLPSFPFFVFIFCFFLGMSYQRFLTLFLKADNNFFCFLKRNCNKREFFHYLNISDLLWFN